MDLENVDSLDDKRDDEYRFAGSYEPKILITTSSSPSAPTVRFAKELKLVIPNSQRINRGQTTENDLANLCRQDDITDLIEISGADGQGRPTMMRICHFPFGPTAQFTISDVTMRADLPEKPPHMSQANPNLIFHKFESKVGECSICPFICSLIYLSTLFSFLICLSFRKAVSINIEIHIPNSHFKIKKSIKFHK